MSMQRDFKDVKSAVTSALVETTKVAGQISNEDLAFHRSSNPSIIPLLDKQNARLLKTARRLAKIATLGTELSAPQLRDVESLDDNWRSVVDVFDNLLEKADACLDEFTGSIKRLSPGQEEQIRKAVPAEGRQKPGKAYRNQNIPKPQLLFNNIPTNEERSPFKPLLRSKPHAIVPLEDSLSPEDSQEAGPKQYDIQTFLWLRDLQRSQDILLTVLKIQTSLRDRNPGFTLSIFYLCQIRSYSIPTLPRNEGCISGYARSGHCHVGRTETDERGCD